MDNFYKKISNSRFYSFGDKLGDLIIMSVLWLVFSLPVITFIPSSAALYYSVKRIKTSSLSASKLFMSSFKSNLKQGILINIIYLLYSIVPAACIFFGYFGIGDVKLPDTYFPFSFVTLIPIVFTLPFAIALLSGYENSIKTTLMNAFTLSAMNIGTTLIIWVIMLLVLVVSVLFFPAVLVLPAIGCKFIVTKCERVFGFANQVEQNRNAEGSSDEDFANNDESDDEYESSESDFDESDETEEEI